MALLNYRKPFIARRRKTYEPKAADPTAPIMLAAVYDPGNSLTLTFDQAIDISALDGSAITIADGVHTGSQYDCDAAATLISPNVVELGLQNLGPAPVSPVTFAASEQCDIVGAVGGLNWPGVGNTALPFP